MGRKRLVEVGQRLGNCLILEIQLDSYSNTSLELLCDCGTKFHRDCSSFKRAKVKSCGCIPTRRARKELVYGVGINDVHEMTCIDGKRSKFYMKWVQMLHRCYFQNRTTTHPSYLETVVCDEWLIFSNFKRWMEQQDWEGKELDKDLLGDGKLYSPENCCFLPKEVNGFLRDNDARGYYIKDKQKFSSSVKHPILKKKIISGSFMTLEEATEGWKKVKRKISEEVIKHFELDNKIANALRSRYE